MTGQSDISQDAHPFQNFHKVNTLKRILTDMGSVLLACSGGTDSLLLLDIAHEVLGSRVAAATVRSPYMFVRESGEAERQARARGVPHYAPCMAYGDGPGDLWRNTGDRCYLCKTHVFSLLQDLRRKLGMAWLIDGTQKDDHPGERPGFRALAELDVRSPLWESGLGKKDIRALARARKLAFWNTPSNSCLLTRLPYNTVVTEEALRRVARAEHILADSGWTGARARVHGRWLRIEADPSALAGIAAQGESLVPRLKEAGFEYVTLDLEGYRPQ